MLRPTLNVPSPTVQRSLRKYTVNGHTFHMVQVQKGRFFMGDNNSGRGREKPAHWVDIAQDFELGQYPVTQALWGAVMGENPSDFKGTERPVENVSWDDIMGMERGIDKGNTKDSFLKRLNNIPEIAALNAEDGRCFALPSEAQWEYAARGGCYWVAFPYEYAGSNYLPEVGWYKNNSQQETQLVGRKLPNSLGLYDMSGNVFEWCEDAWDGNYKDAFKDGSARVTGEEKDIRVVRGGSWGHDDDYSRVANRGGFNTNHQNYNLGFRLARYRNTPKL